MGTRGTESGERFTTMRQQRHFTMLSSEPVHRSTFAQEAVPNSSLAETPKVLDGYVSRFLPVSLRAVARGPSTLCEGSH